MPVVIFKSDGTKCLVKFDDSCCFTRNSYVWCHCNPSTLLINLPITFFIYLHRFYACYKFYLFQSLDKYRYLYSIVVTVLLLLLLLLLLLFLLFVAFIFVVNTGIFVVVVSSHPLHVLSHRSPLTSHSPCTKIVWQSCKDNWLRLLAQPFTMLK